MIETSDGPTLVVAADHSHVDMWSMLVIVRDLLAALDRIQRGEVPAPAHVPAFVEHTQALQDLPPAPEEVQRRWQEVIDAGGGAMPRFPLPLGAPLAHAERVVVRDVLDADALAAYSERARQEGVSTLALTISAMTSTTRDLAGTALRAVFPVHSRYEQRWHDSVGWFITNSVLECASPDPADCARAVREAVALGAHALDPVLGPHGGMPHTPGMFAVSWLDNRRLPVDVDLSLRPQHVSASIRTTGVMVWFVVNATGLHVRCRYPDTGTARYTVGAWLDEVCRGLARRASPVAATAR